MKSMISTEVRIENDTFAFSVCTVCDLGYTGQWIIFQLESMTVYNLLAESEFTGKLP